MVSVDIIAVICSDSNECVMHVKYNKYLFDIATMLCHLNVQLLGWCSCVEDPH